MPHFLASVYASDNGYVLSGDECDLVYEYSDAEGDEVEVWAKLLRDLTFHWGPDDGRHSRKRVHVEVKPGDKWVDPEERHPWYGPCDEMGPHGSCAECEHVRKGGGRWNTK